MEFTPENIIQLVLALIGVATVVVKLTPTARDDKILGKIQHFLSKYIALNEDPDAQRKKREGTLR